MFTTGGWDPDSLALMTCKPHRGHATSSGQPQVARRVVERKVQGDGGGRWQLRFAHMGRAHPATGHAPASGMHSPLQPTHRPCMVLGCGSRHATTPVRTGGASNARERGCRKWEENQHLQRNNASSTGRDQDTCKGGGQGARQGPTHTCTNGRW